MKWIKCSERLPKSNITVLLWAASEINEPGYSTGFYDKKTKRFDTTTLEYTFDYDAVTHWTQLPEPPNDNK